MSTPVFQSASMDGQSPDLPLSIAADEPDQLTRFFEESVDLFCIAECSGYFKVLNRAWEELLGFSRQELLSAPWIRFVHMDDRQATANAWDHIAERGSILSFENRFLCKDGSFKWLLWNAIAAPDQGLIYASGRDITRRKEAELALRQRRDELEDRVRAAGSDLARSYAQISHFRKMEAILREAQEQYRSIFENAVEGIFQSTPEGRYISVNPSMARIKGYASPQELIDAVDDIGRQTYVDPSRRQELKTLMESNSVVTGFEYEAYRKDRSKVWLSMNARAVRDQLGTVLYYEGTIEDITERKRLEEELRSAQKMEAVGRLAGGIGHDFNNLLGVMIGHAEILIQELQLSEPAKTHVEQINRACESAASLVRQLLAFSRKQVLQPSVLDLNAVVTNITKLLARVIGEDITLNTVLDNELGRIKADRTQLEQIVMNLALNARDAMPSGGKLVIETYNVSAADAARYRDSQPSTSPSVLLTVTDTGTGMDAETQAHIFEPFFTTKQRGKGTGLGLASVYGAVQQSGGSIWVESQLGRGTTFKILLPCTSEIAAEPEKEKPRDSQWKGWQTILLVEDDPRLRGLIVRLLTKRGYTVLEAGNGLEALTTAKRFRGSIHLLLTDVILPCIAGPQVAEQLRPLHPEARVLFMSGYADFGADGAIPPKHALLQKPFGQHDLSQKVREALASGCERASAS